jgi:hypothetical protein
MTDPTNEIQIAVGRCNSEDDLCLLEEEYRKAWAHEPDDYSLRRILQEAVAWRRAVLLRKEA